MALAIIGGLPERFAPFAELHREAARQAGPRPARCRSASTRTASSPRPRRQAADDVVPAVTRPDDEDRPRARLAADDARRTSTPAATLRGALFVGSPAEVIEKILFQHEIFGHERFLLQLSVGTMPHRELMRAIELFGTEVAPAVRRELSAAPAAPVPGAI